MALDYASIESAVAAWLVSGSGLPAASVINRNSKVPQPAAPYIEYTVPMAGKGSAGRDEVRQSYDPLAPLGAEVVYATWSHREIVVAVKCTTRAATGSLDASGNYTARAYAEGCMNVLGLPPVLAALKAAGLAFIEVAGINDTSDRSGPLGSGRAQLDVRFRLVDSASATTGFIETVPLDTSGISS